MLHTRSDSFLLAGPPRRSQGWLLIEAMIALTVLTVGVLGFMFSFQANFRATREISSRDLAQTAMDSAIETLRDANFPTLYATYQNYQFPTTGLQATSSGPPVVRVQFHVNETSMPAEYGPLWDIDGDGTMKTTSATANYILLPTHLTLTYQMSFGAETKSVYLVLAAH
jgi:type II secretory pathway pseudopilin PulG